MSQQKHTWNSPESLSGIETDQLVAYRAGERLGIPLNPYQGLKLYPAFPSACICRLGIPLNPYQGLKLADIWLPDGTVKLGIPLNPYQGLKLNVRRPQASLHHPWNSPESLSGIET